MGNRLIRPGGRYRDTVLEVVDPARSALVTSTLLEGSWLSFADGDFIWKKWFDGAGTAHTIVVTVEVTEEPPQC